MPAIVFYGIAGALNAFAWFFFIRSIQRPRRLLNDLFSHEQYIKLRTKKSLRDDYLFFHHRHGDLGIL